MSLDGEKQTPVVGAECCFSQETYSPITIMSQNRIDRKIAVIQHIINIIMKQPKSSATDSLYGQLDHENQNSSL